MFIETPFYLLTSLSTITVTVLKERNRKPPDLTCRVLEKTHPAPEALFKKVETNQIINHAFV